MRRYLYILKFFISPFKIKFFIVLILAIFSAIFEYLTLGLIFNFVNSILNYESKLSVINNGIFVYLQKIVNLLPISDRFISSCIMLGFVAVLNGFFAFLYIYRTEDLVQSIRIYLQRKLSNRYLEAEYKFFLSRKQGDLLFNIIQAPQNVSMVVGLLIKIFISTLTLILFFYLLFVISFNVTLLVIVLCLLFGYFIMHFSKRIGYQEGEKANRALSSLNVVVNEFITGIKEVKVNCLKKDIEELIKNFTDKFFKAKIKVASYRAFLNKIFPAIIIFLIFVGLIYAKQYMRIDFAYLISALVVYILAIMRCLPIMQEMGAQFIDVAHYYPNLKLLFEELNMPETEPSSDGDVYIKEIGEIIFDNVSFKYDKKNILENLSFHLDKNKTTAIVGESGVGKTTVINLILKLYPPHSGRIMVNGIDINKIKRDSLLAHIGCLFQMPILFNRSIGENITFEKDYRKYIDKLNEIMKQVYLDDFIKTLPKGYDTMTGDLGSKLSDGQKQRIVLARVLFKNPDLIILDEPTSSLDNISEKCIMETIKKLKGKKTILIITHKLSILEDVDKIFVLKNRRIYEEGSHNELLKKQGEYFNLYYAKSIPKNNHTNLL